MTPSTHPKQDSCNGTSDHQILYQTLDLVECLCSASIYRDDKEPGPYVQGAHDLAMLIKHQIREKLDMVDVSRENTDSLIKELLLACKTALLTFQGSGFTDSSSVVTQLKQAIAKAEGK